MLSSLIHKIVSSPQASVTKWHTFQIKRPFLQDPKMGWYETGSNYSYFEQNQNNNRKNMGVKLSLLKIGVGKKIEAKVGLTLIRLNGTLTIVMSSL